MNKYETVMNLLEEKIGGGKEEIIAVATISLTLNAQGNPRPATRMVCAYYEAGAFYVSTSASKNKMKEITQNNEVSVAGLGWYTFQGTAENLGWVKEEKNKQILANFKKVFGWFEEVGNEDSTDSIILKITLTEGSIIDHAETKGQQKFVIDFINKIAK